MASHSRQDGSFQAGANNLSFPSSLKWFDKQHYHLFWDLSTAATFSEFSFSTEHISGSHQPIPQDMHDPERKPESTKMSWRALHTQKKLFRLLRVATCLCSHMVKKGRLLSPQPQPKFEADRRLLKETAFSLSVRLRVFITECISDFSLSENPLLLLQWSSSVASSTAWLLLHLDIHS